MKADTVVFVVTLSGTGTLALSPGQLRSCTVSLGVSPTTSVQLGVNKKEHVDEADGLKETPKQLNEFQHISKQDDNATLPTGNSDDDGAWQRTPCPSPTYEQPGPFTRRYSIATFPSSTVSSQGETYKMQSPPLR